MFYDYLKKLFDSTFSIIFLLLFSPILIVISAIVFIETRQFPLFIQERGISLSKYRFRIYKFRTFKKIPERANSNSQSFLLKRDEEKLVTFFGRFLRRTGLDEMPQLINIFKGEMSFIGPRPLELGDLKIMKSEYPEFYQRRESLNMKPGLSGLWQLGKCEDYSVKNLIELEEAYSLKHSLRFDAFLLIKTVKILLLAEHADAVIEKVLPYNQYWGVKLKVEYLISILLVLAGIFQFLN